MTTALPPVLASPVRPGAHAVRDCVTMLRRQLRHLQRYPSMTGMIIGMPVVFLLLFVFVLGGTLGAGVVPGGGRGDYLAYVTPGILLMAMGTAITGTAVGVATDMTEGIVTRFRTMSIFRPAVLLGHVLGSMIQCLLACVVVLVVAIAVGFRPAAGPLGWLTALGVLAAFAFALTWLGVGFGVRSRSVESAGNAPTPLMLAPFLGSGFVPTDSLPPVLRQFAEWQPFTAVIEAVRAALSGAPAGWPLLAALLWSAAIAVGAATWAMRAYNRT